MYRKSMACFNESNGIEQYHYLQLDIYSISTKNNVENTNANLHKYLRSKDKYTHTYVRENR